MGNECQLIRQVTQKLAYVNPKSLKIGNQTGGLPGFEFAAGLCRVRGAVTGSKDLEVIHKDCRLVECGLTVWRMSLLKDSCKQVRPGGWRLVPRMLWFLGL